MFSLVVPVSTVFTPGDGAGSVVFSRLATAGVILGIILAVIAIFLFMVGSDSKQHEESMVFFKAFGVFLVAAIVCFWVSSVFNQYSIPGNSTVEGTVVRVMDTGSDGAELLFDDGKSVRMYKSVNDLKDIQGLRVRLSCDSNKITNDSFDDIHKCEYEKVVSIPSSTTSDSSGGVQQKNNSN